MVNQSKTESHNEQKGNGTRRKHSCLRSCLTLLLIIVIYSLGNIAYGNLLKGQFQYKHSDQSIFSFKYPKKYQVKYYSDEGKAPEILDDIMVKKKCSLFELNFDCGYDITLRFEIFWKGSSGFSATPEEYIQKNSTTYDYIWGSNPNCRYEQTADNKICYIGNYRTVGIIFEQDYMIEISPIPYNSNNKIDSDNILSTLRFN